MSCKPTYKGKRFESLDELKKYLVAERSEGTPLFSKGKPAGFVNLSNKFKPQKRPMSALVAREQAVANAVMV